MKKLGYLLVATAVSVIMFSSCNSVSSKEVKLESLNDSINYSLAVWQGSEFKKNQFQEDKDGKKLAAFVAALDEAYKSEAKTELYNLGLQVGKYIKDQGNPGLFGDSTLTSNEDLILAGIINALYQYEDVMTAAASDSLVQNVSRKVQPQQRY